MNKLVVGALLLLIVSCGVKPQTGGSKSLYEVLTQQPDGGANIRFYEILTEPREISMLTNDENLKDKISSEDITNSNFIILNMGEKTSGGHSITVESVVETSDKIVVTVKENEPSAGGINTTAITYPYSIVKINSKKPIEIK